ncbi:MAG: hypothetical protein AB1632_14815 [Nitrospirota bacterium]
MTLRFLASLEMTGEGLEMKKRKFFNNGHIPGISLYRPTLPGMLK